LVSQTLTHSFDSLQTAVANLLATAVFYATNARFKKYVVQHVTCFYHNQTRNYEPFDKACCIFASEKQTRIYKNLITVMEQNAKKTTQTESDIKSAQLFNDFKNGNVAAFSALYDLHVNMLYNYGYRLTTDSELLKDCIQDVFIKIYNKRNELDSVLNFKSYLLISLKNKLCDESRKRIHLSDVAVEELDTVSSDHVENDYIALEKQHINNAFVSRLLNILSPRQRKAIELYYIEERKYEDICSIMEMNYQSVRNLIHRGMIKLRSVAC